MNRNILIALVILLLLGGGFLFANTMNQSSQPTPTPSPIQAQQPTTEPSSTTTTTPATIGNESMVKEFMVNGSAFKFDPKEIRVKKGDMVKITFKNTGGMHDFVIDELKIATKVLQAGEEETVEFKAEKIGSFEYYCSVGNHRAMGMKGTLVVE